MDLDIVDCEVESCFWKYGFNLVYSFVVMVLGLIFFMWLFLFVGKWF